MSKILVVDDEPTIVELIRDTLSSDCYDDRRCPNRREDSTDYGKRSARSRDSGPDVAGNGWLRSMPANAARP